ncbi:MAG TPA: hypothetical protein VMK12_26345 [Anaeromyxobacteraceae bacterium]|nr:hypothetical protein [Anaeromyxobacteraceae bacterium]
MDGSNEGHRGVVPPRISAFVLAGALVAYFAAFALLTYPAICDFSARFFVDRGDGFQNIWNIWWLSKAVRTGVNPWFTPYLHYPSGTTLVAHTLNPFNGFIAIPLVPFVGMVRAVNAIVVFSFVAGGVTACTLAYRITGDALASFVAGFVFTFCNYHFAHAEGHLNLVSLEWIPLFLLSFWELLERPSSLKGLGAAFALGLVALCDYYYLLYCVLSGAILLVVRFAPRRAWTALAHRHHLQTLAIFAAASCVFVVPLVWGVLALSRHETLIGAHDPLEFSMDLLSPVVPGGHWRFARLTASFWSRLPGNIHESSVDQGISVLALAGIALWRRPADARAWLPWAAITSVFALLSFGPRLQVAGRMSQIPMPYAALAHVLPPLRLSGCPVRMAVMVSLGLGILAGQGLRCMLRRGASLGAIAVGVGLAALLVVEYLPAPIPRTSPQVPGFVAALRDAPKSGGLIDVGAAMGPTAALYYQTIHEIPMVSGYLSRVPKSVADSTAALERIAKQGRSRELCERYGIRYFVFRASTLVAGDFAGAYPWFSNSGLKFYDAGRLWSCGSLRTSATSTR